MYLLFQSIFTWAAPLMDGVEAILAATASLVVPLIGNQLLQDFTSDALFGGIGAFLVFVPQIFVLTFIIGLLEDSGYMARAALICHKPLRFFGLTGKSFIPMLSGVACAIPAIYAARAIDSSTPITSPHANDSVSGGSIPDPASARRIAEWPCCRERSKAA